MMTGLILLAMFAFIVLPTVSQYMRSAGTGMTDPVLAEFNGIELTESRVAAFTQKHYATVQYLRKLAEETMRRGGTPNVPGFQVDQQSNMIQSVGINGSPSPESSVRTLQFAAQAQQQGFDLDQTALELWMTQFTGGTMSEREMYALLRKQTNNRMGQYQLFDMLKKQLLAQIFFRGATATVARGQFPLLTPLDHWQNFLKLNQKATINAYGVLVNDFVDQTNENPSESEIVSVYEAGKERFPDDQSPEPGFRRRQTATFEYVMAELQRFRDKEIDKLSEAEIRAEYERRIAGGDFQLPNEMPSDSPASDSATGEASSPDPSPAETPDPEDSADNQAVQEETMKSEAPAAESSTDENSADENPADDKPEDENPADDKPEDDAAAATDDAAAAEQESSDKQPAAENAEEATPEKTAEEDTADTETAGDADPADDSEAPSAKAPDADEQSQLAAKAAVQLVALQADAEPQADAATESNQQGGEDESDQAAAEAEGNPAETQEGGEQPESTETQPSYREYEEVREQIAQSMVEEDARVALDQAVTKVRAAMKKYWSQRELYRPESGQEEPEKPDLDAMAKELGLVYRKLPPHSPVSIEDEPISNSFEEGTALSQRGVPFTTMMFGSGDPADKQVLFRPAVSVDLEAQRTYVTWKTDETDAYVPELEEVREEVVEAIRFAQARELAKQAAQSIAEQANETSLTEAVPEGKEEQLSKGLGPFSWLNMVGFGSVSIGNVPELDSVGQDFMEGVFMAEKDDVTVAPNQPERVFYVIERTSLLPTTDDLRAIFKQPSERMMAMFMGDGAAGKIQQGFYEAIDEKTSFKFNELEQQ
jgi:hypothetical protein